MSSEGGQPKGVGRTIVLHQSQGNGWAAAVDWEKQPRIEMEISERCKTNIQEGVVRERERMMIENCRVMVVLWKETKIDRE